MEYNVKTIFCNEICRTSSIRFADERMSFTTSSFTEVHSLDVWILKEWVDGEMKWDAKGNEILALAASKPLMVLNRSDHCKHHGSHLYHTWHVVSFILDHSGLFLSSSLHLRRISLGRPVVSQWSKTINFTLVLLSVLFPFTSIHLSQSLPSDLKKSCVDMSKLKVLVLSGILIFLVD